MAKLALFLARQNEAEKQFPRPETNQLKLKN